MLQPAENNSNFVSALGLVRLEMGGGHIVATRNLTRESNKFNFVKFSPGHTSTRETSLV